MSRPQPICSGNARCRAIPATDFAVSRSTRRASTRHPPSTSRRVSTSSHTAHDQVEPTTPPVDNSASQMPQGSAASAGGHRSKPALSPLRSACQLSVATTWSVSPAVDLLIMIQAPRGPWGNFRPMVATYVPEEPAVLRGRPCADVPSRGGGVEGRRSARSCRSPWPWSSIRSRTMMW